MTDRKQELLDELAAIIKQEREQKKGPKNTLKIGIVQKIIWYVDKDQEIKKGFYSTSQLVGSSLFRVGDMVVLLEVDGQHKWFNKKIQLSKNDISEYIGIPETDVQPGWISILSDND